MGFLGTVGPVSVAPLADGLLGGKTVTCPLHERVYDLATGRASAGACDLRTYSVHLGEDGSIALLTLPGDTPGTPWQWSGSAPEP